LITSNPAIVVEGGFAYAKAAVEAIFNVSVPAPPLILSKLLIVEFVALNTSLPEVLVVPLEPTKVPDVSTPVVSDLSSAFISH